MQELKDEERILREAKKQAEEILKAKELERDTEEKLQAAQKQREDEAAETARQAAEAESAGIQKDLIEKIQKCEDDTLQKTQELIGKDTEIETLRLELNSIYETLKNLEVEKLRFNGQIRKVTKRKR